MKMTNLAPVLDINARIDGELANAAAALRVADTKLGKAAAAYAGELRGLDKIDLWEAQMNARLFADLLASDSVEEPALPARVFRAIGSHANRERRNTAHLEGATLALELAARSLEAALELAWQLDGYDVDPAYQLALAARGTVRAYANILESASIGCHQEQVLDAIVAGERLPSREALRQAWMEERMPSLVAA